MYIRAWLGSNALAIPNSIRCLRTDFSLSHLQLLVHFINVTFLCILRSISLVAKILLVVFPIVVASRVQILPPQFPQFPTLFDTVLDPEPCLTEPPENFRASLVNLAGRVLLSRIVARCHRTTSYFLSSLGAADLGKPFIYQFNGSLHLGLPRLQFLPCPGLDRSSRRRSYRKTDRNVGMLASIKAVGRGAWDVVER